MRQVSFSAILLLAVAFATLAPNASAVADAGEAVALRAIREAFPALLDAPNPWTNGNIAGVCGPTVVTGVTCGDIPGEGFRPVGV